jgi:hypothetical protein
MVMSDETVSSDSTYHTLYYTTSIKISRTLMKRNPGAGASQLKSGL